MALIRALGGGGGTSGELITITIHGAVNDVITFTDFAGVSHTVTFASGQTSASEQIYIKIPTCNITFTSSVAKDPLNLSNNYSVVKTISYADTDVYVMPENTLYWWGYSNNLQAMTSANGWSQAYYTFDNPTFNTNYVSLNQPTMMHGKGVGAASAVTFSKLYCVCEGITDSSGQYAVLLSAPSKNMDNAIQPSTSITTSGMSMGQYTITEQSANPVFACYNKTNSNLYALWYD